MKKKILNCFWTVVAIILYPFVLTFMTDMIIEDYWWDVEELDERPSLFKWYLEDFKRVELNK